MSCSYDDVVRPSFPCRRLGAGAVVVLLAATGCSGDEGGGVRVATVGRATVTEVVEAPATVTAKATAEVRSAADGRVGELTVTEGQRVRAGRVLLRITSPRAERQLRDAVRRFNAGLGSLAAAVGSLSSAQRVQTRAAVAAAERTVEALTVRAPISGAVSLTAGSESADAGTDLLDQLPDDVREQAGPLLGGEAGGTSVSGTLSRGQPVRSGQVLLRITDDSALSLTAQVDETDVLLVEPGVQARAELDAVPDAGYAAEVATVDPTPVTSARGGVTYTVRLSLGPGTDRDGRTAPEPRPGMSAVVDLLVRTARDVVAVPAPAVFRDGRRDAVWVVRRGVARLRHVRVGAQGDDRVQVVEGLEGGERVVVRGADRVRDRQPLP
jgi:HlyD family secretion protein